MHRCWAGALILLQACGPDASTAAAAPLRQAEPPAQERPAPKGRWVEAVKKTLRRQLSAVGSFQARRTTRVGPQISGRVEEVLVKVGDTVKKGQELVRLEPALIDIEVAQRKADLDSAQVALDEAELQFGRMKKLWEKPEGQEPSVPRKLYDDAKARRDGALARLTQARGALLWSQERLKETRIRAPYDAVVTKRLVDPGEPVTSAPVSYLLELQDVGVLDLDFSLPQELLPSVRAGTPLEFEVEGVAGSRRPAAISVVFPSLDEATRSFRCRVQIENAEGTFRPGLLARVYVQQEEIRDAVVVPRKALVLSGQGWQVTLQKDGKPAPTPVKAGLILDDEAEVREGVAAGDRVLLPD